MQQVLPAATSNRVLRAVTRASRPVLIFGRSRDYHLDDRNDVDGTGASDMSAVIATYLAEAASDKFKRVYSEAGKTYLLGSQVDVPASVVWEGPSGINPPSGDSTLVTTVKANANGMTMLRLAGRGAGLRGLKIDLNSKTTAVGVRPNSHYQELRDCWFTNVPAGSVALKGGGILYFAAKRCLFNGITGRAIDFLDAYGDNPAATYYGINVGLFEECWVYGASEGMVRLEGRNLTVRKCDFEGAIIAPAVEVSAVSANSFVTLDDNYFELGGVNIGIYLLADTTANITDNHLEGGGAATAGGCGVKFSEYIYGGEITGNYFSDFEVGISRVKRTATTTPGLVIAGNGYNNVTTPITYFDTIPTSAGSAAGGYQDYIQDPARGHLFLGSAVVPSSIQYTTGTDLNLRLGNQFYLQYGSATTVATVSNAIPGMFFSVVAHNGNATLSNAVFNLSEGADHTLAAGEARLFVVDLNGVVRQVTT